MRRRTFKTQHVVDMLEKQHLKVEQVAQLLGVTRQAIWKRLKIEGIDISGRYWLSVKCAFCGGEFRKRLKVIAGQDNSKNYCSIACYAGSRANPNFFYWRHGTRLARLIVGKHFPLTSEMIVHHKDGNDAHNDLSNLAVFANQSDHLKHHHGKSKVEYIWDGATA